MTYKELSDLIIAQIEIDSGLRGIPPIKLTRKLIFLWISQAEKYIQRRFKVLKSTATISLSNKTGSLPDDYGEMIEVNNYKLVRWNELDSVSYYAYAIDNKTKKIKVNQDVDEIEIYYALKLGTTVDTTNNAFELDWADVNCEKYSESNDNWDANTYDAICVELKLPEYQKATEYLVLGNVFKEYKQLAEAELLNIGYQEEKPTQIEGGLGY